MPAGTLIPNTQQELINRAQMRETYLLWLITDTLQEGAPLLSQLQSLGLLVEGGYYRVYTLKVYPAERSLDHALLMQQLRAMAEQVLQDRKLRGEMCIDHSSVLNIVVNSDVKAIAAAPMIQDGRTFVPFRALAEAFGAEVEWVEATQSVVAELNGVKVVMNIGEKAYTVDGKVLNADVAPFINGASTMVPVRFVAEAFGINVTPIAAADGSVADVLFAK